ncbi:MAG: amino acid synthesis family protein [Homoserinimonas sp.]
MSDFRLTRDDLKLTVRKWVTQVEEVLSDGQKDTERPIRKAVIAAVVVNPYAGRWSADLSELIDAGEVLADVFMTRGMELLGGEVQAYGKGGVVGENGEIEHIAALLHPKFGGPTRAITEGISILPSVKKRGGQGATLDIPVHHKDAMMIRSHFDSVEFRVGDAPRADEIVVALAVTDGPRPHHRVGGLTESEATAKDGLR